MQVTQHVALLSKWVAADLYAKELDLLQFELSMSRCSVDMWAAVEAVQAAHAAADGVRFLLIFLKPSAMFTLSPSHIVYIFFI
jgi:phosphoenolpyruvate carboxylase